MLKNRITDVERLMSRDGNEGKSSTFTKKAGAGCKPNSVAAGKQWRLFISALAKSRVKRPTRPLRRAISTGANLVLLRMGFALLLMSPPGR